MFQCVVFIITPHMKSWTGALRSIECFRYILEYSGKYVFSCKFLEKIAKSKKKINR